MAYFSEYTGAQIERFLAAVKQHLIDSGKVLSTNDFTNALKTKLDGLSNYNDTELRQQVNEIRADLDLLLSGDTSTAIESFNEVVAFLNGLEDSENLDSIISALETQKQDKLVSGTSIKTVNGKTLLGSGDISAAKSYTESSSTNVMLLPNVYTRQTNTPTILKITLSAAINTTIMNEYFIEFTCAAAGTTVSFPSTVKWINDTTPTFEAGCTYQVSIINNLGTWIKFA